jgi:hypothetical protein
MAEPHVVCSLKHGDDVKLLGGRAESGPPSAALVLLPRVFCDSYRSLRLGVIWMALHKHQEAFSPEAWREGSTWNLQGCLARGLGQQRGKWSRPRCHFRVTHVDHTVTKDLALGLSIII